MRKLNIAFAIVSAALILEACSLPGGNQTLTPYALTVAPKAISVNVPTSLVTSTPGARSLAARGFSGGGAGFFKDENRGAYHWVKDTMWQAQKRLARAAVRLVLADSIIASNGLVAGTAAAPTHQAATVDHVWTDAEVAAFRAMIPPSFLGNSGFESDAKLPKAGDVGKLPAFDYSAVDPADTVNASYALKVVFAAAQSEDDSAATLVETNSYYWSGDKTRFKAAYEKDDTSASPATVVEMNFVAYDSATSTLAAGRQGAEGSMSLAVKSDPASSTNGVFITFGSTILADKVSDYQADSSLSTSGTSLALSAAGYADNAGGYVDETLVVTVASAAPQTFYFKETFDAAGKLVLAQTATDSSFSSLTTISGVAGEVSDVSGVAGAYDGKKNEVETEKQSMEGSQASGDVAKEERHHAGQVAGGGFELEFTLPATVPAVGDVWGVFTDAALTVQVGSGTIVEIGATTGQLRVVFTTRPAQGTTSLYLAKLVNSVPDTGNVITVQFDH